MRNRQPLILCLKLLVILFLLIGLWREWLRNRPTRQQLNSLRHEAQALNRESRALQERLTKLGDALNREKELKDHLNLAPAGERVIILPQGW